MWTNEGIPLLRNFPTLTESKGDGIHPGVDLETELNLPTRRCVTQEYLPSLKRYVEGFSADVQT
jgi:hypothetical protein